MKSIATAAALLLTGCTVSPKVQYQEIKAPSDMAGASDSFFLQKSVVRIEKAGLSQGKDEAGASVTIAEVSIKSRPMEERARKFSIKPISNWMRKTNVNIVKVSNTDMISSIGVETTDQAAKSISDIGGAIVKVVSTAAGVFSVQSCKFPVEIPVTGNEVQFKDPNNCATVTLGELPLDVIKVTDIPKGVDTGFLYYSACRDATVTLTINNSTIEKSQVVRVSDPNFVQMVALPYKGTVTMHSECGVSVVTQAVAESNAVPVITALATQGKAIKDALEAAKK
jgi:hypothetical protein